MDMLKIKDNHTGGDAYALFDVENNRYIYAQQMMDDYPTWGDLCSGTAVIDVRNIPTVDDSAVDPAHSPDVQALETANRVLDSYRSQDYDMRMHGGEKELHEIALQVANRAGVHVYGISHYTYDTRVTDNLEHCEYLCFTVQNNEVSDYHGREFAAMCNSYRWSVHTGPLDRVNQWVEDGWGTTEDYDYFGQSTNDTYGYTWLDIDSSGDSTPTKSELIEVSDHV